jgi:hypothetical protein
MNGFQPLLLVRARPRADARERFDYWFREVHLQDVRRIPGIVDARVGRTAGGTRLGFYTFADGETVEKGFQSPEAAYARGTWEQWVPMLEEFMIEMWAPLFSLPMYRSNS